MENNQLQTVNQKLTTSIGELSSLLPQISEPAQEIVKARFSGVMFKDMALENIFISAEILLSDLAILTGIKTPTAEGFGRLKTFVAESLKEDYPNYTVPLIQQGLKKCCDVLTTGGAKSYGRILSLADFKQVMDSFLFEVQDADKEVKEHLEKQAKKINLSEDQKQNIIRESIERQYQANDFDCTYADFNQLVRDGFLTENSLRKNAYEAIKNLKEKYLSISAKIPYAKNEAESLKGVVEKRECLEKIKLLGILEDEIKAETASLFLKWCKENNRQKIYTNER